MARNTVLLSVAAFAWLGLSGSAARGEVVRAAYSPVVVSSSGKCLDIEGASSQAGAPALVQQCNSNENERWTLEPFAGAYRVRVRHSGQCLSVAGDSTGAGAAIVQTPCTGKDSELWSFPLGVRGVQLQNQHSALCANVSDAAADAVLQSPCDAVASNFDWVFSSGLFRPSEPLVLQATHSGKCLNVSGASLEPGASIIQWPCLGQTNEQLTLVPEGIAYRLVMRHSGACVAVNGASSSSGAPLVQAACSGAPNELWALAPVEHAYRLVAQHSGLCAAVDAASPADAAPLVQVSCSSAPSQLWSVAPAAIPSRWSDPIALPVNPIAAANLPDGRLITWSAYDEFDFQGDIGNQPSQTYTSVFNPETGASSPVLVTHLGYDMFCPGTANLPDGRILVNGGSSSPKTSLYDPATGDWSLTGAMNIPRGYQGTALLSNGSVFTLGGSWSGGEGGKHGEVWTDGSWRRLTGVRAEPITAPDPAGVFRGDNHLWLFAASGGRLFHAGPSAPMHWITTDGNGTLTPAGDRGSDPYSINGNAVLYDVGQILKAGGSPAYQDVNATSAAVHIDFSGTVSVSPLAPMAYARAFANGVVLPNGQVVIVGGQTFPVPFSDDTAILVPEIWDPDTRVFRQLEPMTTPRVYHSTAILLPDGRVFSGGGGQCGAGCPGNHFDAEILTPPYLLNPDGSLAARPSITSAPATGALGGTLAVTTDTPVMSFSLVRLSSVTHSLNNDQRRVPLAIQATSVATSYTLSVPSDPGVVLPGYYLLFALDARGVPSVAATLRIN
jgi:galactose oxidase